MNPKRTRCRATKAASSIRTRRELKSFSRYVDSHAVIMYPESFLAPESIRPVFCCGDITPRDPNYVSIIGPIKSSLQRSHLSNFVSNISTFSLNNGVPVAGLTWSKDAEYLVQVLKYHKKDVRKTKRKKKDRRKKTRGKESEENWVQVELGRYFVETKHEKGKRWRNHAFEELLIMEEGIPNVFNIVVEVRLEVRCGLHVGV